MKAVNRVHGTSHEEVELSPGQPGVKGVSGVKCLGLYHVRGQESSKEAKNGALISSKSVHPTDSKNLVRDTSSENVRLIASTGLQTSKRNGYHMPSTAP